MVNDEELVTRFRGHGVDHDTAPYFRGLLEHRLMINCCKDCGHYRHPPRPICPVCWSVNVQPTQVSGSGVIHLLILLHQGPPAEGVDYSKPYPVATVELDEQPGLRFTSTVVGADNAELAIGKRVTLDWIERGGAPLPVFRLAAESRT